MYTMRSSSPVIFNLLLNVYRDITWKKNNACKKVAEISGASGERVPLVLLARFSNLIWKMQEWSQAYNNVNQATDFHPELICV